MVSIFVTLLKLGYYPHLNSEHAFLLTERLSPVSILLSVSFSDTSQNCQFDTFDKYQGNWWL